MTRTCTPSPSDELKGRLRRLGLYGVLAHWETYAGAPWLGGVLEVEEAERKKRSLERRVRNAKLGRFKPLADFDWTWPKVVDRELVDEILTLSFLEGVNDGEGAGNVIFMGPNGVGKTTLAKNVTYQALLQGYTACFTTASEMLTDLASQDGAAALARRLRRYCQPALLAVDEVGYLSYGSRHADLLFEVISRRAEEKSTLVTTNRPFTEWSEVFPNATSVVALVDRLAQRADVVMIEADSYRLKEAKERQALRTKRSKKKKATRQPAKKKATRRPTRKKR